MNAPTRRSGTVLTVAILGVALAVTGASLSTVAAQTRDGDFERSDPPAYRIAPAPTSSIVALPAGSVDALEAAVVAAGRGGVVLVEAGIHTEQSVVTISTPVSIVGEPGAVIESLTTPAGAGPPYLVEGALHVLDTNDVTITGLELRPIGDQSNTAILVENSPRVTVASNLISGYNAGIIVQNGDRVDLSGNTLNLTGLDHGIVIVNGEFARVTDNSITNAVFGIWACDRMGRAAGNVTAGTFIGIILCNVPPEVLISGQVVGSDRPATGWHVQNNQASSSFWGYAVSDGSTDNVLANNAAFENSIDIEVLGDSSFFGFFTPTATDSVIAIGANPGLTVHDCGIDTTISGTAVLLDTSQVPCF
jgi:parallel beta-helix repeat protein